jgi:hypothetical protein
VGLVRPKLTGVQPEEAYYLVEIIFPRFTSGNPPGVNGFRISASYNAIVELFPMGEGGVGCLLRDHASD